MLPPVYWVSFTLSTLRLFVFFRNKFYNMQKLFKMKKPTHLSLSILKLGESSLFLIAWILTWLFYVYFFWFGKCDFRFSYLVQARVCMNLYMRNYFNFNFKYVRCRINCLYWIEYWKRFLDLKLIMLKINHQTVQKCL